MKWDNYKSIKKSDWQEIARQFEIEYEESSVVRYLVEKIAEKLGIDDKIVSDNELKRQVFEKIKSEYEIVPLDDKSESTDSNDVKIEEVVEKAPLSRLEELRLECESYGIAWSEIHTEQNLEQVLNGVKSAGVQPLKDVPNVSNNVINTNESFEINSDNANEIQNSVINAPVNIGSNPAFNPMSAPVEPPVNGGYKTSNTYLKTYGDIYLNAIKNHFRLLTINEINEMISRDKHAFTHHVNVNPKQSNKVEILLVQGTDKLRVPSNTDEWIDING
jgi:hypothetical protein